jgi:hypothetical protein
MCEADRLNRMASHEIDMQRGNGSWNLAAIQQILNQTQCDKDDHVQPSGA